MSLQLMSRWNPPPTPTLVYITVMMVSVVTKSLKINDQIVAIERKVEKKSLKVIPLKLFYYQTFFETWRNEHTWYEHYNSRESYGVSKAESSGRPFQTSVCHCK